jgi:hypothetical protein
VQGDHAGSYGNPLAKASELYTAGKSEVFEDLDAEGVEAA